MSFDSDALDMLLPVYPVDKNVLRLSGSLSIPSGYTEGVFRIAHNQGQALLPVGYFSALSSNITVEPNYQGDSVVFHVACDSTDVIISYYKITTTGGTVNYTIILVAK